MGSIVHRRPIASSGSDESTSRHRKANMNEKSLDRALVKCASRDPYLARVFVAVVKAGVAKDAEALLPRLLASLADVQPAAQLRRGLGQHVLHILPPRVVGGVHGQLEIRRKHQHVARKAILKHLPLLNSFTQPMVSGIAHYNNLRAQASGFDAQPA